MLSTEVGEEWVLQDPANGWSRNAQSDHPVSFHFLSNRTFCASFFLSVFMQLPTREHLRKSLLKTLQLMGWHVSATRHLFITICTDLLSCLNLVMSPLVTASCSQGEVLCSGNGARERFTTSIMWQSDICRRRFRARWCRKRSICWRWHCLRRCCCNITIYHPEKNSSGLLRADFDTFLDTPHFLGYIRKGWANFHIDIWLVSERWKPSAAYEGVRRWIWLNL